MEPNELDERIRQAAKDSKVLRIKYTNLKDETQTRNIEPYEIRDGKLWGYCRKKKGIRQFSLDRIQTARPTSYTYFPKWPVKINEDSLNKQASASNPWFYTLLEPVFGPYHEAELE